MNSKMLLEIVEKAVSERKDEGQKYWVICYHKRQIQCLGSKCPAKPEIIFLTVSAMDCERGFSPAQWVLLEKRISKFWKEKNL